MSLPIQQMIRISRTNCTDPLNGHRDHFKMASCSSSQYSTVTLEMLQKSQPSRQTRMKHDLNEHYGCSPDDARQSRASLLLLYNKFKHNPDAKLSSIFIESSSVVSTILVVSSSKVDYFIPTENVDKETKQPR